MKVHTISRKREVLGYFQEYKYAISDDLDTVTVSVGELKVYKEGESIFTILEEALKEIKVKRGEMFMVEITHDCPGCCLVTHPLEGWKLSAPWKTRMFQAA